MYRFFLTSLIAALVLGIGAGRILGDDFGPASGLEIAKRYDEAKFFYTQLQTNRKMASSRDNWLKGTSNFRRIYLAGPKSDFAAACLFMLGRLYGDMNDRFNTPRDLEESVSYFEDIVRLFPGHKLADDAYYTLGTIYLNKKKNPQKAAEFYAVIVTDYQSGDMHPQAENQLKILSKEHNIALPGAMMSGNNLTNQLNYVLPVKYWSSKTYTRVVIMASGPVNYNDVLLEKTGRRPARLYIDFKKSYIEPRYRSPVPIEDGLLKRIRTGQFSPDTVRVVLDIESLSSYKIFSLPDPFRVVIDVRGENGVTGKKVAISASAQKRIFIAPTGRNSRLVILKGSKKTVPGRNNLRAVADIDKVSGHGFAFQPSLAQQLGLGVNKIVIDPGHGGKDPGASAYNLKEKDIVLRLARLLSPTLKKELGCEVILTRSSDVFIPLEERTAIANTENADLFVSLHINAHPSGNVRGFETYFLNLSTNAEAMRVAAMENATSTHQMSDLQDILSDIMKNSKIEESSRLAQHVHNSILDKAKQNGFSKLKNLGVKQAPFYVLIGAQMPAILLEIAFITNQDDVKNLQSDQFLDMLTREITAGIRNYVNNTTAGYLGFTTGTLQ
ncbi:N-acetylmuramoyl-L-alanine amidase [Desulforhopalus singaporensis]|uniref:N-acetylmuramoyl-L-alanine amidase n=1 Tax=Desulforhopalus singaporensis TaxID=91360 RepID=A0A1H0JPA1_9BACT|nr:N-acetylmuramoyl-L-alanine amidase [Desulforhopalus singaporensis]SDO45625.1 N-acetylmuramoyl-L-alanine amidase [Desulforhopalus singaporensis]